MNLPVFPGCQPSAACNRLVPPEAQASQDFDVAVLASRYLGSPSAGMMVAHALRMGHDRACKLVKKKNEKTPAFTEVFSCNTCEGIATDRGTH